MVQIKCLVHHISDSQGELRLQSKWLSV